jgi:hypothetical protein
MTRILVPFFFTADAVIPIVPDSHVVEESAFAREAFLTCLAWSTRQRTHHVVILGDEGRQYIHGFH